MDNIYIVNKITKGELQINGKADSHIWQQANILESFRSPWDSKVIKKIDFRALWDEYKLFFCFKVYDSEVHIHPSKNINDSINNSDRVELFFKKDDTMNPYYCLEIDPTSRIMDFKAYPQKVFDFDWEWPSKDIVVKSSIEKQYFIVEIAISINSLESFNLIKDGKIETGIYRAKYNKNEKGVYEPTWICWIDPKTESPNFHIATSFGVLQLENYFE
ncbi:sugar-binding protein [Seonamhaeicola sp.]|uniref:sugar-binding protein n=1 Tax=Seonamhaeicola sp. TaxID=1912245 RepID=UPI00261E8C51|nr:sugar-binding protein [Seonamhaeicola sp.]